MDNVLSINGERLQNRLKELGEIGRNEDGELTRLALSDTEKAGRDAFVGWVKEAGLEVAVDKIGNTFGIWKTPENEDKKPVMMGSHIDSVINAGIYDGCYGVLSGLEVIQTLKESGYKPARPMVVGAFANEEGVRYSPDMFGSLVYVGGWELEEALKTEGIDGTLYGEELERIGYAGTEEPGFIKPHAYIELHIEQGPILDSMDIPIGAVEGVQGISWQNITIEGVANHAGTTPTSMRIDAGLAAAKVMTFLREHCEKSDGSTVATTGCIEFEPNLVNVIPSKATFTVDIRDANEEKFVEAEEALKGYLKELEKTDGVKVSTEKLARFDPVYFDQDIVKIVEDSAKKRGLETKRMTSGAGHDAQMLSRICPTAMIFAPSIKGISHNPKEDTKAEDLVAGTNVLLDAITNIIEA